MYKLLKSQDSSITLIMIIVLGALVAAAGIYFIYLGGRGTSSVSLSEAKSQCESACYQDGLKILRGSSLNGECTLREDARNFCSKSFLISGRRFLCYEVSECILTLEDGTNCKVTHNTCGEV